MNVVGLDLEGDVPADTIPVAAVLIVDVIATDGERRLHLLASPMPPWAQLGMVAAIDGQLRDELATAWEGD